MNELIKILLVLVLLSGCSSAPIIIEKEIEVPVVVPEIRDTTILLRDTVFVKDSVWFGEVKDSVGKVIGDLTVYFQKKIASINIKPDTVLVPVIIRDTVSTDGDNLIPAVVGVLSWWEQTILYGGIGLTLALLIGMRLKRGKI